MIDWLAQRYVELATNVDLFLENPTGCPWIGSFRFVGTVLLAGWFSRLVYLLFRGRRLGRLGHKHGTSWARVSQLFETACQDLERVTVRTTVRDRLRALVASRPVRLLARDGVVLCNVGLLKPRIILSERVAELLDDGQLESAIAHEISHIVHHDNLKRVLAEALTLMVPIGVWMVASMKMVTAPIGSFFGHAILGVLFGLLVYVAVLPILYYWQERRCDEWAALAVGDRLVVASALVEIAQEGTRRRTTSVPPRQMATPFFFHRHAVTARVNRLLSGNGQAAVLADRWGQPAVGLSLLALGFVSLLTIQRAQTLPRPFVLPFSLTSLRSLFVSFDEDGAFAVMKCVRPGPDQEVLASSSACTTACETVERRVCLTNSSSTEEKGEGATAP